MKTIIWKRKWLLSPTVICSLWLSGVVATALETTITVAADDSVVATQTNDTALARPAAETREAVTNAETRSAEPTPSTKPAKEGSYTRQREAIVAYGRHVEVKEGESAEAVVVIGGSATVRGKVREGVVAIGGNLDIEGEVGDAAVTVMGNVKVSKGTRCAAMSWRWEATSTLKVKWAARRLP